MTLRKKLRRVQKLALRPIRLYVLGRRDPLIRSLIRAVRAERLTYVPPEGLMDLACATKDIEARGLPGAVVEAGAALGGSAIVLAAAKSPHRPMRVYDTFGMIPPPSDRDGTDVQRRYLKIARGESRGIGGDVYYGYREDLLGEVQQSFVRHDLDPSPNHVDFVQGHFEDTLTVDFPVALAHLDCDWYASVRFCLESIDPKLVAGGRFVVDDYDSWSGCTEAVNEFLAEHTEYRVVRKTRLHLVKETTV